MALTKGLELTPGRKKAEKTAVQRTSEGLEGKEQGEGGSDELHRT